MQHVEFFCDICETPLTRKTTAVDCCGEEYVICDHDIYTTTARDTKNIFPHLCKKCASKLDYMFSRMDSLEKKRIDMIQKRYALNEKRKRRLNTNG